MYMLKDGWREESSEGPYTETLQTKVIEGESYQICRLYNNETKFTLQVGHTALGKFDSLALAKEAAATHAAKKV